MKLKTSVLGSTDLTVSKVGFGAYRVHEFESEHREALRAALLGGCNLIDTSTNYTDGSSERLVGDVLSELISLAKLKREEVVVVTKCGYVQGENLKEAKSRKEAGRSLPEMVEYQTDCWHNISPEYLEDQITHSLERLKLDSIDVLLLHNPEYFLKAGGSRDVYYARLEKAFKHLESERSKGRIRHYGVSSNTFPEVESRSDFTSLAKVLETVGSIGKTNHFSVIELPFNLFESGAALIKNNNRETVLEFAAKMKLGVLTNRPFNSFHRDRLVRLTSFPEHDEVAIKGSLHTTLGRAVELEKKLPGYPKLPQGLLWAHSLRERIGDLDDVLVWREVLYTQIFPSIRQALTRLPQDQQAWSTEYQDTMQELLRLVTYDLENLANQKNAILKDQMASLVPSLTSSATLSRQMIRIYTALPQVSSVLIGMRTPPYVSDVLGCEESLPEAEALEVLTRMQRHRS